MDKPVKTSEWVPVNKELPKDSRSVLIYTQDGGVAEGCLVQQTGKWLMFRWSIPNARVIAWMELPKYDRPALTDEQREVLVWLHKGGYKLVARDSDESYQPSMMATVTKICRSNYQWYAKHDETFVRGERLFCLRPLLPDWTVPLDVEKTLRDAGVEA